ncbi:choline transporter-like protein 5 isoform 2-T2 [Amazona ochrocephala]
MQHGGGQGRGPGSGGSSGCSVLLTPVKDFWVPCAVPVRRGTRSREGAETGHRTRASQRHIACIPQRVVLGQARNCPSQSRVPGKGRRREAGVSAWVNGDPRKVIYPSDSYSFWQFCSQKDTPSENRTILYHFNILKCASPIVLINLQCPGTQLCVSECPDRFVTYTDVQASYRCKPDQWNYLKQSCKPGFKSPRKSAAQVLRDEDCPSMIIPSRPRGWFYFLHTP